jgi:hypothetical protein
MFLLTRFSLKLNNLNRPIAGNDMYVKDFYGEHFNL